MLKTIKTTGSVMSYEYKELIEQAIIDDDRPLDWEEGFKELDEVYAQAAKADEYEAKAKAYDDTLKTLDKLINDDERYKEARSNDFVAGMLIAYENIFNLMEDYIKEGCEYDVKK